MITSQVVAAHRPPPPPPPAAAPDFRFCSGSGSALLPQLSTFLCCSSQNLHGASGGVATHSFPSSFCPSLLCACACSRPNGARCPPVYHLPPPPTPCLASHVSSPLCACVQALAAFCRLNSSAPVTCYRQPRRVRQAATAHVPPPSTPAPVRSAQNIFAPATARRVCDCIINGRRARMRGGSGRRGAEWAGAGAGECGK